MSSLNYGIDLFLITSNLEKKSCKNSNFSFIKAFLDTKEVELSKTTDFLAYYALPYVEHPRVFLFIMLEPS